MILAGAEEGENESYYLKVTVVQLGEMKRSGDGWW